MTIANFVNAALRAPPLTSWVWDRQREVIQGPQETMMGFQFSAGTVGEGSQINYSISGKNKL